MGTNGGVFLLLNALGTAGPAAVLSSNTLVFANRTVGQSSSPQTVMLTYMASTALNITGITISGAQSGDYQQTNTCGTTLAAGAGCTISVTFSPKGAGARTAAIQIADNAINSAQTISLSGTGAGAASIGLGVPSGASSSATVTAGQTASYTLSIGGAGIGGTATLTCSGAPSNAVCSVPGTEQFSGSTATSFKVSVSTTSGTTAALGAPILRSAPWMWATALIGWIVLPYRRSGNPRRKRPLRYLPVLFLIVLFLGSCGGSGPPSRGTPAGTYTLKVMAASNSITQSTTLNLTVQ